MLKTKTMFIHPLKIGSIELQNNLMLSPLAGITDIVFRTIAKRYGCGLVFSEMVNSNGVLHGGVKTLRKMDFSEKEKTICIQIAGDNPKIMADVAKQSEDLGAEILNINMGCPAKKVTKTKAGCALMTDPVLVKNIIRTVKKSISIPLSIKIRLGWDTTQKNYLEISKIAESEGCRFVILHARTRVQAFTGCAQWDDIRILKENLKIPVIGNGDITSAQTAYDMFRQTNCDGIMIGRGALGRPWIFREILSHSEGQSHAWRRSEESSSKFLAPKARNDFDVTLEERKEVILEHLKGAMERYGTNGAILMRKHFSWYSRGLAHSSFFRQKINQMKDPNEIIDFIHNFFKMIEIEKAYDLPLERQNLESPLMKST